MTPTLSKTGQRLYDATESLQRDEETNGFPLAYYSNGYAAMLDTIATLVSDQDDGTPGWAWLFDPDTAPAGWLPWLEFFAGVNPYPAVDEAGRRLRIKQTDGRKRGTPKAIRGAARQFLVGPDGTNATATVYLIQRVGGVATDYTVATIASETPDSDLVQAALEEQKPAGFNMTYSTIVGGDYATLKAVHTDYADVKAQFATYADVRADPSLT